MELIYSIAKITRALARRLLDGVATERLLACLIRAARRLGESRGNKLKAKLRIKTETRSTNFGVLYYCTIAGR